MRDSAIELSFPVSRPRLRRFGTNRRVLLVDDTKVTQQLASAMLHDVRHLVDLALGIGFWTTPIVYEMAMVPESARFALLLSPLTPFVRAYQDIFYYGVMPEPALWVAAGTYAVAASVGGLSVFLAHEAQFSELV